MSAAEAILKQNTHSETLMAALPALHRAALGSNYKTIFLAILRYWISFKEERKNTNPPLARDVLRFLACAEEVSRTQEERDAVQVITSGWESFAPTEYFLGCI